MATKTARKSGSKKMSAKRGAKKAAGQSGPLGAVVAALNRSRIRHDILIRGTPVPDVIKGTITAASAGQASTALNALFKAKGVQYKPVRLFPKGIPFPDIIRIDVEGKLMR